MAEKKRAKKYDNMLAQADKMRESAKSVKIILL